VLDLFDREAVRRSIAGFDAIVNLATHIPPPGLKTFFASSWKETGRIREHGSALLVDEALSSGARLFVQESFGPIYPDSADRWITEETHPQPAPYNEATLKAEASADRFTKGGGRGIALRFAYFYGPGDGFTLETFKYVRRGWLPLFGRPDGYFSTVNHDDAALAVLAALDAPSGIYNVVDNEPLTRRQLGDVLSELLKVPPPRTPPAWLMRLTGSMGETLARSLRISNAKLRNTTTWTPRYATAREGWRAVFQDEQQRLTVS
jgi:nucleoside-diphosphate-sugar epimerase